MLAANTAVSSLFISKFLDLPFEQTIFLTQRWNCSIPTGVRWKSDAKLRVLSGITLFGRQRLAPAESLISLQELGSNKKDGCAAPGVAAYMAVKLK